LYVREKLSEETLESVDAYNGSSPISSEFKTDLIHDLNRLLKGENIYEENRFAYIQLSAKARRLIFKNPEGKDLIRLNRYLLQEAFPKEIEPKLYVRKYLSLILAIALWGLIYFSQRLRIKNYLSAPKK